MRSVTARFAFVYVLPVVAAAPLVIAAAPSSAAILGAQYTIDISPSERVLAALGTAEFDQVLHEESCDNPHLRVRARNKPSFLITNGANATAPIESFTIMINEGPYMFGDGDAPTDNFTGFIRESIYSPDPEVSILGSSISADGTALTINFDGFSAGRSVIFAIDIDANDPNMYPFPDYRTVLFGAPLSSVADPTDPGSFSALYANGDGENREERIVGGEFPQHEETLTWFNGNIRPYHTMDKMEVMVVEIPEPGSWALATLAVGGIALVARRRKASC